MENVDLEKRIQVYRSLYKERILSGGIKKGDGSKSAAAPFFEILLGKKDYSAREFLTRHGAQLYQLYQKRGEAILSIGLNDVEIEDLTSMLADKLGDALSLNEKVAILLMFPEFADSPPEELLTRFGAKMKSMLMKAEGIGGLLMSWMSSIPGLKK